MLNLTQFILLAFVAATPALVTALSSPSSFAGKGFGNAIRGAAIFTLTAGILVIGGGYLGHWLLGMLQGQQNWIANSLWFVVGLKMLLASRNSASHPLGVDMNQLKAVVMIGLANGLNAMLIGVSMGLLEEAVSLFSLLVAVFVFILSLAGVFLSGLYPALIPKARWLYPFSGVLMILLALVLF